MLKCNNKYKRDNTISVIQTYKFSKYIFILYLLQLFKYYLVHRMLVKMIGINLIIIFIFILNKLHLIFPKLILYVYSRSE